MSRSDDPGFFGQGGKTKMFERGTAHDVEPGVSGKARNGGSDKKWPEGGRGKMFGKGHAGHKEPGISGKASQVG
jgi:hypothetical protein